MEASTPILKLDDLNRRDRLTIESFRGAAQLIDEIAAPHYKRSFQIKFGVPNEEEEVDLIPYHEFRSLALAIRLVYAPSETARFQKALKIARRTGVEWVESACKLLERDWQLSLRGSESLLRIDEVGYSPEQILDHWIKGVSFHKAPARNPHVRRLRMADPWSSWLLQMAVRDLAVTVRNLDTVIARLLGEPPLPPMDAIRPPRKPHQF